MMTEQDKQDAAAILRLFVLWYGQTPEYHQIASRISEFLESKKRAGMELE